MLPHTQDVGFVNSVAGKKQKVQFRKSALRHNNPVGSARQRRTTLNGIVQSSTMSAEPLYPHIPAGPALAETKESLHAVSKRSVQYTPSTVMPHASFMVNDPGPTTRGNPSWMCLSNIEGRQPW